MIRIPLTQDKVALVDDLDYPILSKHQWCAVKLNGKYYAARRDTNSATGALLLMHRAILNLPAKRVDHKNGDGLDNQRHNLRLVTHAQNLANQKVRVTSRTGYKGVSITPYGRFHARIRVAGQPHDLGTFATGIEAASAYNVAAEKYFGEFARLNSV